MCDWIPFHVTGVLTVGSGSASQLSAAGSPDTVTFRVRGEHVRQRADACDFASIGRAALDSYLPSGNNEGFLSARPSKEMSGRLEAAAGGVMWRRTIALVMALAMPTAASAGPLTDAVEKAGKELSARKADEETRGRAWFCTGLGSLQAAACRDARQHRAR